MKIWARGSNICDKNQEWDRGMLSQAKIASCSKINRNLEFQYHKLKTRLKTIYLFEIVSSQHTNINFAAVAVVDIQTIVSQPPVDLLLEFIFPILYYNY